MYRMEAELDTLREQLRKAQTAQQVAEQQKEKVTEKLSVAEEKNRELETENDYLRKRVTELEREINTVEVLFLVL